jgi:diacylglycerol kinase family enzyme
MKSLAIVINAKAGSVADSHDLVARLQAVCDAKKVAVKIYSVKPSRLEAVLVKLRDKGMGRVIVGGGDGTLNTAANLLVNSDTALGVLPLGTFNLFATDLGLPLAPEKALALLLDGQAKRMDAGEINGRYFLTKASLGLHPLAIQTREHLQWRLPKRMAMTYALFILLWRLPQQRLRLDLDNGESLDIVTPFVLLGNNRFQPQPLTFPKRESFSDGTLSVYFSRHANRLALLKMAFNTILGRSFSMLPEMQEHNARRVSIRRKKTRRLRVSVDGEVMKIAVPLDVRIHQQALWIIQPR